MATVYHASVSTEISTRTGPRPYHVIEFNLYPPIIHTGDLKVKFTKILLPPVGRLIVSDPQRLTDPNASSKNYIAMLVKGLTSAETERAAILNASDGDASRNSPDESSNDGSDDATSSDKYLIDTNLQHVLSKFMKSRDGKTIMAYALYGVNAIFYSSYGIVDMMNNLLKLIGIHKMINFNHDDGYVIPKVNENAAIPPTKWFVDINPRSSATIPKLCNILGWGFHAKRTGVDFDDTFFYYEPDHSGSVNILKYGQVLKSCLFRNGMEFIQCGFIFETNRGEPILSRPITVQIPLINHPEGMAIIYEPLNTSPFEVPVPARGRMGGQIILEKLKMYIVCADPEQLFEISPGHALACMEFIAGNAGVD
jgi:hypothetical protein